jgi:putative spermidine/putrescine transport system ATP-binding protein
MRVELRAMQQALGITFIHVTHTNTEAIATSDLVVVMNRGVVVQADSPGQVYQKPLSPFVARFVGGHNVFSGPVVEKRDNGDVINAGGGQRLWLPHGPVFDDNQRALVVRKEQLELGLTSQNGKGTDENLCQVSGTIQAIEYEGTRFKITITLPNEEVIIALLAPEVFLDAGFEIGSQVTASWKPEVIHVLTQS